jgi:hypothetical protein
MKVLVSAYACEPGKGSEPAVGWNWIVQIARFHEVWAITRSSNRRAIEMSLAGKPLGNVHWLYYDLPAWARFWKRGAEYISITASGRPPPTCLPGGCTGGSPSTSFIT